MSDPPAGKLRGHHADREPPGLNPSVSWALGPSLAQPSLAEALQSEAEQDDSLSDFWAAQGQSMESLTEESLARTATVSLSRTSTRLNKRAPQRRPAVQENTEVLASYSPQILIDHLMSGPLRNDPLTSDSPPERLSFWGAVVFVDVSGFTKLSEALSKEHGAVVGAELLNEYINSFFEQLIDVVLASGGDIIKFAGDAMQVIWRVPETITSERAGTRVEPPNQFLYGLEIAGLPELVLQAARCCLAMLTKFHGFTPTKGVSLALHMGIGAGFIDGFIVGGIQNKWEFFIAGEPIEQMSEAGEIATSGELALSTRATQALMTALEAAALESRPKKLNRHDRKRYEALAALDAKLRKGSWEKNGSGHDFYLIVGHSSSVLETLLRSDHVAWVLRPFELSPSEANRSSAAVEYLPSFFFRRAAAAIGAVAGAMGRPERASSVNVNASSDPGASGARSALSASHLDEPLASTYPGSLSETSLDGLDEDSGETPSPSRRVLLREATFSDSLTSPGREVAFSASLQASRQEAVASRAPPSSAPSLRRAATSSKGALVGGEGAARPKPQRTRSWIVRKAAPRSSDELSTDAAELVAQQQQQQRRRERLELLLRSFVPALVEERVEAGARDGWLSERLHADCMLIAC
jgi:class 3 adenylate cyclase